MATSIRLQRTGTNKRPMYRLIVIDKAKANTGGVIENLGMVDFSGKALVQQVKEPRVLHWLSLGAQPSETAKSVLKKTGTWAKAVAARVKK